MTPSFRDLALLYGIPLGSVVFAFTAFQVLGPLVPTLPHEALPWVVFAGWAWLATTQWSMAFAMAWTGWFHRKRPMKALGAPTHRSQAPLAHGLTFWALVFGPVVQGVLIAYADLPLR